MPRERQSLAREKDDGTWASGFLTYVTEQQRMMRPRTWRDRLATALVELRPYLRSADAPILPKPCVGDLKSFFAHLAAPLDRGRAAGSLINPWVVAGLKRNELRNASALASLWNPLLTGPVAVEFLTAFIEQIADGREAALPSLVSITSCYVVRTEHHPTGERSDRVDLTLEGHDFVLGIEIKIDAPPGQEQLQRYLRSLDGRATGLHKCAFLIFLAPYKLELSELGAETFSRVVFADWQDVSKAARSCLPRHREDRTFNHYLINAFAAHVSGFRGE